MIKSWWILVVIYIAEFLDFYVDRAGFSCLYSLLKQFRCQLVRWARTLKVQIFVGTTYFRGDLFSRTTRVNIKFRAYLFSRIGGILVLFLYFCALFNVFWTIFREAPRKGPFRGDLFSRMAENFPQSRKCLQTKICITYIQSSSSFIPLSPHS